MAALDLDELKNHLVDPPIGDDELETLLTDALESIDERIGPQGTVTEYRRARGPLLPLGRRAESITLVVENDVELDPSLYRLRPSGEVLERLSGVWCGTVAVTLEPVEDTAKRKRVAIGLVKLDLAYTPGVSAETLGQFTEASSQQQGITYERLREEYLASLVTNPGFIR